MSYRNSGELEFKRNCWAPVLIRKCNRLLLLFSITDSAVGSDRRIIDSD